jgi:hypothetical protein
VQCADGRYRVYTVGGWEPTNQFRPAPGKYVGVMDDGDMSRNQNYFTQYCCTMVLVGNPDLIPQLHSYGYSLDNIFIGLGPSGWQETVEAAIYEYGVKRFYIDEPIRNSYQQFVRDASAYIASRGGTLTISESYFDWYDWYINEGRGTIGAMVDLALSCSPQPFVCCHTHFDDFGLLDPRDQWTYIKNSGASSLFKMVIIKSRQTADEMDLLWGHANNLGINQVMLYPFNADGSYAGVQTAMGTGDLEGWVQRYFMALRDVWCCPTFYWEENVCTYQYSEYTGGGEWQ